MKQDAQHANMLRFRLQSLEKYILNAIISFIRCKTKENSKAVITLYAKSASPCLKSRSAISNDIKWNKNVELDIFIKRLI